MFVKYKNGVEIYMADNAESTVIRQLRTGDKWRVNLPGNEIVTVREAIAAGRMIEVEKNAADEWVPAKSRQCVHEHFHVYGTVSGRHYHTCSTVVQADNIDTDIINDYIVIRRKDVELLPKKKKDQLETVCNAISIFNLSKKNLLTAREIKGRVLRSYMEQNSDLLKEAKRAGFKEGLKKAKEEQKEDRQRAFEKGVARAKKETEKKENKIREFNRVLHQLHLDFEGQW